MCKWTQIAVSWEHSETICLDFPWPFLAFPAHRLVAAAQRTSEMARHEFSQAFADCGLADVRHFLHCHRSRLGALYAHALQPKHH